MPAKNTHDAARAKTAKERKILLALAPVLAIAVFFAYHTLHKLQTPSAPTAAPAAATTPASTVAAATTPATTTPSTATPPVTGTPVAAAIAAPVDGTLTHLSLFSAKDPFHDQGPRASSGSGSPSSSGAAKKSKQSKQSKSKPAKTTPAAPVPPPTSAVIGVNGKLFDVPVGGTIPLDAAFGSYVRLKALTGRTATLGGRDLGKPVRLTVGSSVKLTDQAGHAYVIVLFPQGTSVPGAPAATTQTTTTTSP